MLPNMYIWGSLKMGFSPDSAHFWREAPETFWVFEIVIYWSDLAELAFYPDIIPIKRQNV